ncbi:MBG-2 domain-containing protein, partial [Flavisolibacter sp. BT320]|nr:MBG-2 domain-containing protein [Flavisolibacter longurius]
MYSFLPSTLLRGERKLSVRMGLTALLFAVLFFGGAFSAQAQYLQNVGPVTVTTDKPDYTPRSNAVFSGTGFQPGETVQLKVKNLSRPCNTVTADSSYLPWTVKADTEGNFATNWTVCDCAGDSLRLKATGQTSAFIAYAYFTDANFIATTSGPWNQGATWGNSGNNVAGSGYPGATDIVAIPGNNIVTVTGAESCMTLTIGGGSNNTIGTLKFNSSTTLTVSGNVALGTNGNRQGSLDMASGGTLKIGGSFTAPVMGIFTPGDGAIEFNGAGAQTILPTSSLGNTAYTNLALTGSGTKSFNANITITGNLSITGSSARLANGTTSSAATLTLGGIGQVSGSWGSTNASTPATNKNSTFFGSTTTGIINISTSSVPKINAVPLTLASALKTTYGTPSAPQTSSISGSNLIANIIATAPTGFEVSSDGSTYGTTATFVQTNGTVSGTLSIRLAAAAAVLGNYNSQNIVLTSSSAATVNVVTTSSGNIVTPATLTYAANAATKVYGEANPPLSGSITGFVNGQTQATATTGTLAFTSATIATSIVGNYAINGSGLTANNGNYTFVQAGDNATALTITQRSLNFTGAKVYDGTATFAATQLDLGNIVNSDAVTLTGNATVSSQNAATYTNFVANNLVSSNSNYIVTGGTVSLSISQATPTIILTPGTYTYNGSAQGPNDATNTGTGTTYTFSYVGVNGTNYTASSTAPTNAGYYTVTATVAASADGNFKSNNSTAVPFTINTRRVVITADAKSKTYGEADPALTYQITEGSLVSGDAFSG